MRGHKLEVLGRKFGRLRVLRRVRRSGKHQFVECRCECGRLHVTAAAALVSAKCKSCGCGRGKPAIHGMGDGAPVYWSWANMKQRCTNKRASSFKYYGGKGVTVCLGFQTFANFYAVMGEKKQPGDSIGRTLDLGAYSCGRCIECTRQGWKRNASWQSRTQQGRERRLKNQKLKLAMKVAMKLVQAA